ncbi:MAG: glycosyltransferase family 9 protein [Thermoanaerobaculia bacterium]
MRLLIVRLSALGDIVHTLPLAENARLAGASVGWVSEGRYRDLLEGNPNLERLFLADKRGWRQDPAGRETRQSLWDLRRELVSFGADRVIDAQGLWKSAVLARAAGSPVVGFAASERREGSSALLCAMRVRPPETARHVVDRNLALLSAVGIPVVRRAPDARYLLARPEPDAAAFLASQPRPYALYHPGAGRPEKVWSEEKLAAVARRLEACGLHPVVSWGPGDEPRAERMEALLPGSRRVPRLPVHGLAHVAAGAEIFLGADTGPLHLADAVGVATLALFGPTDPERNGPYRGSSLHFDSATTPEAVTSRAIEILEARRGGS